MIQICVAQGDTRQELATILKKMARPFLEAGCGGILEGDGVN
jgi:hypothetical protein